MDIDAPGNGLPIQLIRHFSIPNAAGGLNYYSGHFTANGMVDWQMEIPHLETLSAARGTAGLGTWFFIDDTDRCTGLSTAPEMYRNYGTSQSFWYAEEWWHGYQLMIPGHGSQDLLSRASGNALAPAAMTVDGQSVSFPYTTKAFWAIGCLDSTSNGAPGEGFLVVSPEGTKYWLDHLAAFDAHPLTASGSYHPLQRKWAMMLVSKVEDRFGNTLTYTYAAGTDRLTSITASDGRSLSLAWERWPNNASVYRIASATLHASDTDDRTYTYAYDDAGYPYTPFLKSVTRPDDSQWTFDLSGLQVSDPAVEGGLYGAYCALADTDTYHGDEGSGTITSPSGLLGTFTDELITRGRSHVFYGCVDPFGSLGDAYADYPSSPPLYTVQAITKRHYSGAGLGTQTWTYDYSAPNACYTTNNHICDASSPTTVYTNVEDPQGHTTRSTFSNRFDASESLLQGVKVYTGGATSALMRSETHAYATSGAWPSPIGHGYQSWMNQDQVTKLAPQTLRHIVQDGDTYTWEATAFNGYAQPLTILRHNTISGEPSYAEGHTYFNDTAHWVLGQPLKTINLAGTVGDTSDDTEVSKRVYGATTGLLKDSYRFGRKVMSYTWHGQSDDAPGTLASFTDANNHATTLDDYKRGIPQTITYADLTSKTLDVDDVGDIQSITNERNRTTSYDYDDLHRLTHIDYPSGDSDADGPQTWAAVDIDYLFVATTEYGVSGSHLRVTRTQGRKRSTVIYNALLQPVLTISRDTSGSGGDSGHMVWRDYDAAGRTTFTSYPLAYAATLPTCPSASTCPGVTTGYDALGRIADTWADSELGPLKTSTQYLAGNTARVTDPKLHVTTTTYQALDAPAYDKPLNLTFADGTETTIERDVYGKPLSMTEAGTYDSNPISVVHGFVYNAYQQLCLQTSPETGQTAYGYDSGGRLQWSAQGLSGYTDCASEASVSAAKVSRTYDARNRLTGIDYPSGTPDTTLSYYDDGTLHTASRNGAGWTLLWNRRGLLTGETLAIDGKSFHLGYGFDAEGDRDAIHYPSGRSLALGPDGLGRPTQAGVYASGVGYAPSGMVTDLTWGNGVTLSRSPNTRNLIHTTAYAVDGTTLTDRTLGYDANGNLTTISDAVQGALPPADRIFASGFDGALPPAGTDARTYTYDVLDRLTSMQSGRYGTEGYSYDPLGNVRRRSFGGNTLTFGYDAVHNRLSTVTGPSTNAYGHDTRGNVTSAGNFALTWNRANELAIDSFGTSYAYDARGWRVKQVVNAAHTSDGTVHTRYFVYDSAHRLLERWDNGTVTDFVTLGRLPVARITSNVATYIHTDYQNTPLLETVVSGAVTRSPPFLAYGQTDLSGVSEVPGYTGAAPDKETGLLYLGARYLSAPRFLSPDPAPLDPTSPSGLNRYAYAADNPARYTDRSGRAPDTDFGLGAQGRWFAAHPQAAKPLVPIAVGGVAVMAGPLIFTAGVELLNSKGLYLAFSLFTHERDVVTALEAAAERRRVAEIIQETLKKTDALISDLKPPPESILPLVQLPTVRPPPVKPPTIPPPVQVPDVRPPPPPPSEKEPALPEALREGL